MGQSLDGRLVLLTGASSGIGRAAAAIFVERGARVLGVARSAERLATLSREVGGSSRLVALPADVADAASMEALASRVREEFGTPDVIVANAGIGLDALLAETDDDALRTVFEVNVYGLVRTVRPFLPAMVDRGSGRILLVSSIVGKRGVPHYSAYSASKFALHGIADALRSELWSSGVSVGVICPSSTKTGFHSRLLERGPRQRRVRPRRQSAETVARALVKMATNRRVEQIVTVEGKLMTLVDCLAPRLIDWILARALTGVKSRALSGAGRR